MLALNDPRWDTLKSNYTTGAQVAKLLAKLEAGTLEEDDEEQLWQDLCHQYTCSQAGYAAVPHLISIAKSYTHQRGLELLGQAAHILACKHMPGSQPVPDFLIDSLEGAYQQGLQVARDILDGEIHDPVEIRYFLASLASLLKFPDLYFLLEGADSLYECPNCQKEFAPLEVIQGFWQLKG